MEGFLEPGEVLNKLDLRKDMIAADFGSGSGGWVLPLAKKLEDGKVYSIDILEDPLSALKAKANLDKISNIETIESNIEKTSKLLTSTCDLVLITNLLFEVEDKKFVLEEAKRVLKPEGEILVVDWKKDVLLGPKGREVSLNEIKKIAEELDLKLEKEFDAGLYHWVLLFKK
jgi:ubiquinone/menaquinone biosynthesis C-methylase UbiE